MKRISSVILTIQFIFTIVLAAQNIMVIKPPEQYLD